MTNGDGTCACCGDVTEKNQGKEVFNFYCRPCCFFPQLFNYKFKLREPAAKVKVSGLCVDCGRPATCRDHRDYGDLSRIDPVCHGCNRRRGAAKFPAYAVELAARIKASGDLSYRNIKKQFYRAWDEVHPRRTTRARTCGNEKDL